MNGRRPTSNEAWKETGCETVARRVKVRGHSARGETLVCSTCRVTLQEAFAFFCLGDLCVLDNKSKGRNEEVQHKK